MTSANNAVNTAVHAPAKNITVSRSPVRPAARLMRVMRGTRLRVMVMGGRGSVIAVYRADRRVSGNKFTPIFGLGWLINPELGTA
jgi:hypothetical protein